MTVDELIADLRVMPPTAIVRVIIRKNESFDGTIQDLYDFRDVGIATVVYSLAEVKVQLDE